MSESKDPRLKILIIITVVLITGGVIAGIIGIRTEKNEGRADMQIDSENFDFGTISMADGLVKHTFNIENEGTGDLKISDISTSCMCTEAVLDINGEKSSVFGMHNNQLFWSKKLKPGESAELEVTFDPAFHGPEGMGPVTRTVTMYTNDKSNENMKKEFTITAEVIK